jgi:D-sedoheptulose 7-phosphate isomerase
MRPSIAEHLQQTSDTLRAMMAHAPEVEKVAERVCQALRQGKKIVVFGNGGSAADAQHFAAELTGRYEAERTPLPAIAFTTDTSALTAVGNDYGYEFVFSRQATALVNEGDIVFAISTSGNSPSVMEGVAAAHAKKAWVVALTGQTGGKLKSVADVCLCVPSQRTSHIQECHIALLHAICGRIDQALLPATV